MLLCKFLKPRKEKGISLWYYIILKMLEKEKERISKALADQPWLHIRIT
jgi:hypothetical protein